MKQLQLELKKRLLIVEFEDLEHLENVISCDKQGIRFCSDDDEPTKLICKGSELSDGDIILFVHYWYNEMTDELFCRDYKSNMIDNLDADSLKHSFISAIESKGWYWGENPEGKLRPRISNYSSMIAYKGDASDWDKAETRTLSPSKCIIFEIL